MIYVLENKAGKLLSGFYPNEAKKNRFLVYRKNDYMIFNTLKEAKQELEYIRKHKVGRNLEIQSYL